MERTSRGIKMIYYKNKESKIYAYKRALRETDLTLITEEEVKLILNPALTVVQIAKAAQSEMIAELNWIDLQLKIHNTNDTKRMVSTVDLLCKYAIECRDYVQNIEGVLAIVGDKPVRPE